MSVTERRGQSRRPVRISVAAEGEVNGREGDNGTGEQAAKSAHGFKLMGIEAALAKRFRHAGSGRAEGADAPSPAPFYCIDGRPAYPGVTYGAEPSPCRRGHRR